MLRLLILAYLAVVLGPLVLAGAAFALRDLVAGRARSRWRRDGHSESEGLDYTVEEARST